MKYNPFLKFLALFLLTNILLLQTVHSIPVKYSIDERIQAKGNGLLLLNDLSTLFRQEALQKFADIKSQRTYKEEMNKQLCLDSTYNQANDFSMSFASNDCYISGQRPLFMNNELQTQVLDGAVIYIREIRTPLVGLMASSVFSDFTENTFNLDEIYTVWNNTRINISKTEPSSLSENQITWNPNDLEGRLYLINYKIMLSSLVIMFDTYEQVLKEYLFDTEVRKSVRYMSNVNQDVKQTLIKLWENAESGETLPEISKAIDLYNKLQNETSQYPTPKGLSPKLKSLDKQLDNIIQNSLAHRYSIESPDKLVERSGFRQRFLQSMESIRSWFRDKAHYLSKLFGTSAGAGQCRNGIMYQQYHDDIKALNNISSNFKAGDILLEKTPFRTTDKYIPGYWGHVAIWAGTKDELVDYGIWEQLPELHQQAVKHYNYPASPTFQESILSGHAVIEALLKNGVEMNTFQHFIDIDDMAIIRPRPCQVTSNTKSQSENTSCMTREQTREAILNSFKQVGKKYDFVFDVHSKDEIVCSELAYQAYTFIDFEISHSVGTMSSISPDQIAFKADKPDSPFYPTLIYHNGVKMKGNETGLLTIFNKLNEDTEESLDWVHSNTNTKEIPRCN